MIWIWMWIDGGYFLDRYKVYSTHVHVYLCTYIVHVHMSPWM